MSLKRRDFLKYGSRDLRVWPWGRLPGPRSFESWDAFGCSTGHAWKFGVMADTQWIGTDDGRTPTPWQWTSSRNSTSSSSSRESNSSSRSATWSIPKAPHPWILRPSSGRRCISRNRFLSVAGQSRRQPGFRHRSRPGVPPDPNGTDEQHSRRRMDRPQRRPQPALSAQVRPAFPLRDRYRVPGGADRLQRPLLRLRLQQRTIRAARPVHPHHRHIAFHPGRCADHVDGRTVGRQARRQPRLCLRSQGNHDAEPHRRPLRPAERTSRP